MSHRELSVSTSAHISPALFPDSISANVQKCLCLVQADFQAPQLQYLHDLYHWASVIFYILWLWPGPSPRQIEMLLLVQPHSVLFIIPWNTSLVAQMVKSLPAMQETLLQSLGREDSLEKGNGNLFQDSCLGNPMDRGAWWSTVHGVAKNRTWLND